MAKARKKDKPLVWRTIYIGGAEWLIIESDDARVDKMLQDGLDPEFTGNGRCLAANKQIVIRKGLPIQDRYETIVHEGIHAICEENRHFDPFCKIFKSEEFTHILTKGIVSYLRQIGSMGTIGG